MTDRRRRHLDPDRIAASLPEGFKLVSGNRVQGRNHVLEVQATAIRVVECSCPGESSEPAVLRSPLTSALLKAADAPCSSSARWFTKPQESGSGPTQINGIAAARAQALRRPKLRAQLALLSSCARGEALGVDLPVEPPPTTLELQATARWALTNWDLETDLGDLVVARRAARAEKHVGFVRWLGSLGDDGLTTIAEAAVERVGRGELVAVTEALLARQELFEGAFPPPPADSERWPAWLVLLAQWYLPDVMVGVQFEAGEDHGLRASGGHGFGPLAHRQDGSGVHVDGRAPGPIVCGPSGSGKTQSLLASAVGAVGGVVFVSTKPEEDLDFALLEVISSNRPLAYFSCGSTVLNHPGARPVRWNLLAGVGDLDAASRLSSRLISSSAMANVSDGDFWREAAMRLVSPIILWAAGRGGTIADVVAVVESGPSSEAMTEAQGWLLRTGHSDAAGQLASVTRSSGFGEDRTVLSILQTASSALRPYSLAGVRSHMAYAGEEPLGPDELEGSGAFVVAVSDETEAAGVAAVTSLFIEQLVAARIRRGSYLDAPPLLIVGDEVGATTRIDGLDRLLADGAGRGIQTVVTLQSLGQLDRTYGPGARERFTSTAGAILAFPGSRGLRDLLLESSMGTISEVRPGEVAVIDAQGVALATPVQSHRWPPLRRAVRDAMALTDPDLSMSCLKLSTPTITKHLGEGGREPL